MSAATPESDTTGPDGQGSLYLVIAFPAQEELSYLAEDKAGNFSPWATLFRGLLVFNRGATQRTPLFIRSGGVQTQVYQ